MKPSILKLPALFGFFYVIFAILTVIAASMTAVTQGFSLIRVAANLFSWESRWWWLSIVGVLLHVLSYMHSLRHPRLMVANGLGVCVYIAYALIPNYSVIIILVHIVVIALLMQYHPQPVQVTDTREDPHDLV